MCWWSTGIEQTNVPAIAATRGAHMPAAFTTVSASMRPDSVSTARTSRCGDSSMPVTSVPVRISTPSSRAAAASA